MVPTLIRPARMSAEQAARHQAMQAWYHAQAASAYNCTSSATTTTISQLCGLTCSAGTACVTNCGTHPVWVLTTSSATASATTVVDDLQWHPIAPGQVYHYVSQRAPGPTDQELYERAVAEHNDQEAERLRRVIAEREAARQRAAVVEAERQRVAAEQIALRVAATERAHQFLMEHLTAPQRETFTKNGWFVVEGGRSKEQYRIHVHSAAGNIRVMKGNGKQERDGDRLCCHAPYGTIPLGDQLLAQKLMLEFAEDDFLRIANRSAA